MNYYWQQDKKTKLRNASKNNMSADIKLSKAQISKIIPSGGFLGSLLSKLAGPLIKVAVPLAKNMLAPLRRTAAASAIDAEIQKKDTCFWNNYFNDFKQRKEWHTENCSSSWNSNILLRRVTKTNKNETKKQKEEFLSLLLGTLGASLAGNILAGKGIVRAGYRNKKGKGIIRAGYGSRKFSDSRDNIPNKTKDRAYVIKFDEYADTGTHLIALFCTEMEVIYLDSFEVEHVPKEIEKFIEHKNIETIILRIQSNNSIMNVWTLLLWIYWFYVCR